MVSLSKLQRQRMCRRFSGTSRSAVMDDFHDGLEIAGAPDHLHIKIKVVARAREHEIPREPRLLASTHRPLVHQSTCDVFPFPAGRIKPALLSSRAPRVEDLLRAMTRGNMTMSCLGLRTPNFDRMP